MKQLERPELEIPDSIRQSAYRYKSILPFVRNKNVFEFGCGIGHGSEMLAEVASSVLAWELQYRLVRNDLYKKPTFLKRDYWTEVDLINIDIIASVDVIEHLEKEELIEKIKIFSKLVKEIAITTPPGDTYPYHPMSMEERRGFHVWHYTYQELEEIFKAYYKFVEIYYSVWDPRYKMMTNALVYARN